MHKCHKVRQHQANKEKPIYLCNWVWIFITFAKMLNHEKVFIPNNVTKIQEKAFWNTQIEELHIPISVTFIDYFAFEKCVGLKNGHQKNINYSHIKRSFFMIL